MRPAGFAWTAGRTKRASSREADELGWAGPGCMGMPSSLDRMERRRRPLPKDAGEGMCDVALGGTEPLSQRQDQEGLRLKPRRSHACQQGDQPARGLCRQ